MSRLTLLVAACAVGSYAQGATMLFDFGRTDTQTTPNWNNVVPATTSIFALFDSTGGIVPGAAFEITDPFFQVGEPTANIGSTTPSGDAGAFPASATSDPFFGHNGNFAGQEPNPLGQFVLSGLDVNQFYDFTFFASRQPVGDIRESLYTVDGSTSGTALLDASNNDSEVAKIMGIIPDANGDITVSVESGPNSTSNFYYLNVMQVDASPIPEPSSLALAAAIGLTGVARRR